MAIVQTIYVRTNEGGSNKEITLFRYSGDVLLF